jgi:hypothetical protein
VAWVALAPLLVALSEASLSRAAALGFVTGVVYFTGTLYWITRVMAVYGGLQPVVAVLVNGLLIIYLALFPVLFAAVTRRLVLSYGQRALLMAPLVWVATELGRTYLLTGFPWVLLGYSQVAVLPVAQAASLFGVYGLSALVAAVSATVAYAIGPAKAGPHVDDRPAEAGRHKRDVASGFSRTTTRDVASVFSRTFPLAAAAVRLPASRSGGVCALGAERSRKGPRFASRLSRGALSRI